MSETVISVDLDGVVCPFNTEHKSAPDARHAAVGQCRILPGMPCCAQHTNGALPPKRCPLLMGAVKVVRKDGEE